MTQIMSEDLAIGNGSPVIANPSLRELGKQTRKC